MGDMQVVHKDAAVNLLANALHRNVNAQVLYCQIFSSYF